MPPTYDEFFAADVPTELNALQHPSPEEACHGNYPEGPSAAENEKTGSLPAAHLTPEEKSLVAALVEDGLAIQDRFRPEPLYKETGHGHFESRSVEEIQAI